MKWFKHECTSHNDEKTRELIHSLGAEGYGILMICYELVGEKIDEKRIAKIEISWRVLSEKCRTRQDKLRKMLKTSAFQSLLVSNFRGDYVELFCPNLLNRLDNWTERQKNYRATTEQLTANKKEKEKKKESSVGSRREGQTLKPCQFCKKGFMDFMIDTHEQECDKKPVAA